MEYTDRLLRDTVITVDLNALAHNLRTIRALVGPDVAIMAVVKANAYGHGAAAVAPVFLENGVTYLAVATLTEALDLKAACPEAPIFILGQTPARLMDIVASEGFTQAVTGLEEAKALSEAACALGRRAKVHLKFDTGLVRLGMRDLAEALEIAKLPGLEIEGAFSHLALAGAESDRAQFEKFLAFTDGLTAAGVPLRYRHIADSVATVDVPAYRLNMVRPGSLCYGLHSWDSDAEVDVRQVLRFETKVSAVHTVEAGEGASYEHRWRAKRPSLIATLPFGYCDGYPRRLYEQGYVTIKGVRCPFAGLIGMDQCMVDATDVPDLAPGDPVVIYGLGDGDGMSLQEAADLCKTFKNDIIARLMARPLRVYVR